MARGYLKNKKDILVEIILLYLKIKILANGKNIIYITISTSISCPSVCLFVRHKPTSSNEQM